MNIVPRAAEVNARLIEQLGSFDRSAFVAHLATALTTLPTAARLKQLAEKNPVAHAAYVQSYAKLAGFTDKTENISVHAHMHLHAMSDVDLHARLRETLAKLDSVSPITIDAPHTDDTISVQTNSSAQGPTPQPTDQNKSHKRDRGRRVR